MYMSFSTRTYHVSFSSYIIDYTIKNMFQFNIYLSWKYPFLSSFPFFLDSIWFLFFNIKIRLRINYMNSI